MTELQYEKKILELNQYIDRINDIMWQKFMVKSIEPSMEDVGKIMEVLNEWAENN